MINSLQEDHSSPAHLPAGKGGVALPPSLRLLLTWPWPRSIFISLAIILVFLLAFVLFITFVPSPWVRSVFSDVLSTLSAVLVCVAVVNVIRNSRRDPLLRLAWSMVLVSAVFNLVGEVTWYLLEIVFQIQAFPSLADVFYLLYYPFAALAIFLMPRPKLSAREKIKSILDIGIILLGGFMLFWNFLIGPILFQAGESVPPLQTFISAAYPVFDLALLWALFGALAHLLGRYNRWPIALLALGITSQILSDSIYSYQALTGAYSSGSLVDAGWLFAYACIGLAAVVQSVSPSSGRLEGELDTLPLKLGGVQVHLPYIWVGAGYITLMWSFNHATPMSSASLAVILGIVIVLVVTRQIVALRENNLLTSQLRQELAERKRTALKLKFQKELFEKLVEVAHVTTSSQTLNACLQTVLRVSLDITNAERGSLFLVNEDGETTSGILARGDTITRHMVLVKRVMDEGLAGWVYRNQKSALIPDVSQDPRWVPTPVLDYTVRSALGVPIGMGNKILGVLTVHHHEENHFTREQVQFLMAAAQQMALALQNAQSFEEQRRLAAELKVARDSADDLLLNILPSPIAARLKAGETVIADYCPDATVLFADLVDFTPFAGVVSPAQLVTTLNLIFSRFDDIVEKYGVEKIKTSGDAYIIVDGLNPGRERHVQAIADTALEMLKVIHELQDEHQIPFSVRIGIHTGPVVAGVIGKRKFSYDLWGDTVNIASRMESQGVTGFIQVTWDIYAALCSQGSEYEFQERGLVTIKGKGDMRTYLLLRRRSPEELLTFRSFH